MISAGPGELVASGQSLKPQITSPFLASGLLKSASAASEGTSTAFCQEKCIWTVHLPPTVPVERSWAPTPVWRSIRGQAAGREGAHVVKLPRTQAA